MNALTYVAYMSRFHNSHRIGTYRTLAGALKKASCGSCQCGGGKVHAIIDGVEQIQSLDLYALPSAVLTAQRAATADELAHASQLFPI